MFKLGLLDDSMENLVDQARNSDYVLVFLLPFLFYSFGFVCLLHWNDLFSRAFPALKKFTGWKYAA